MIMQKQCVKVFKWKINLTQTGKHLNMKYAGYSVMWCISLPHCCTGKPRCCTPAAWHRWC